MGELPSTKMKQKFYNLTTLNDLRWLAQTSKFQNPDARLFILKTEEECKVTYEQIKANKVSLRFNEKQIMDVDMSILKADIDKMTNIDKREKLERDVTPIVKQDLNAKEDE